MKLNAIITAKKLNIKVPPVLINTGNIQDNKADHTQWVVLPNTWPLERILLGNISEINTQITAPKEIAKNAMKDIRHISI